MHVIDPHPPKVPPGQDELPSSDGEPMETPRHVAQYREGGSWRRFVDASGVVLPTGSDLADAVRKLDAAERRIAELEAKQRG